MPQLLYTLRPITDSDELAALGDQDDSTDFGQEYQLSGSVVRSWDSSLGTAEALPVPLVNYIKVFVRGRVVLPSAGSYSDAKVYATLDEVELALPVADWTGSFETRTVTLLVDPSGDQWTIESILRAVYGGRCTLTGTHNTTPYPDFRVSEVWVEVYGIPNEELQSTRFQAGRYELRIEPASYVADLTASEVRSTYITAARSGVVLNFGALSLANGQITSTNPASPNSTYAGMIDAIQGAQTSGLPEGM